LGEQSVKNIPKPVGAYRVLMKPDAAGKVIGEKRFLGRYSRKTAMAAIIILVMIAGGLVSWNIYLQQSKKVEPASLDKMAYPLPDKPSIAVLPFENMSDDPEQEYFCDGLTEDIITALSKTPKLFVIARNSTFTYKNKPVKVQKVAEDLGVQYVMEGSVRVSEDRVRITAQLIDATTGHHIWAESYDRKILDIFALQDEITKQILTAMQVNLTEGEFANLLSKGTNNLKAYLKTVQAIEHFRLMTKDENLRSRQKAEEARALDSDYPIAWGVIAWTHLNDVLFGWSESPKRSIEQALEITQKVRDLGGSFDERALALEPNSSDINAFAGLLYNYSVRPEEAIGLIQKAMRLNPHYPSWYLHHLALSYHLSGRYDEAVEADKNLLARNERNWIFFAHIGLALSYTYLGREKEAHAHVEEILKIRPDYTLEHYTKHMHKRYNDTSLIERSVDAMRKAGLPEHAPSK
jgi:adenylate cyclase